MFDWQLFLDRHNIEYVTTGHNARRHVIAIACPFCGDDPSQHMGISTRGRGWHCWRNERLHTGKAPHRLIMALLRCSFPEAVRLVVSSETTFVTSDETFAEDVFRKLGQVVEHRRAAPTGPIELLPEFRPLTNSAMCRAIIYPYLIKERLYRERDISELADRFKLHYARSGRFSYRVIMPIEMDRQLVNWTGRSVVRGQELRYRSLSTDPERAEREGLPVAPVNIKETLFDYDNVMRGGETLVTCEGPMDAMRITFFGERYGIRGTALFSKTPTDVQLDLLTEAGSRYDEHFSAMDQDAFDTVLMFPDYLGMKPLKWPRKYKDPAEFPLDVFEQIFKIS